MVELTKKTSRLICSVIPAQQQEHVRKRLLEEVSENIPVCDEHSPEEMERIRFSILRLLYEGKMHEDHAFDLACVAWRDLFMAAGHGHDTNAHSAWADSILNDKS